MIIFFFFFVHWMEYRRLASLVWAWYSMSVYIVHKYSNIIKARWLPELPSERVSVCVRGIFHFTFTLPKSFGCLANFEWEAKRAKRRHHVDSSVLINLKLQSSILMKYYRIIIRILQYGWSLKPYCNLVRLPVHTVCVCVCVNLRISNACNIPLDGLRNFCLCNTAHCANAQPSKRNVFLPQKKSCSKSKNIVCCCWVQKLSTINSNEWMHGENILSPHLHIVLFHSNTTHFIFCYLFRFYTCTRAHSFFLTAAKTLTNTGRFKMNRTEHKKAKRKKNNNTKYKCNTYWI